MKTKAVKKVPFDFIIENLYSLSPIVKPMFGAYAVYIEEKIIFVLRNHKDHKEANGIWVATSAEHHTSLRKEIPCLTSIDILSGGKGETNWQMVSMDDDNFEGYATQLCEMVLRKDERIGRIPKPKKKKSK